MSQTEALVAAKEAKIVYISCGQNGLYGFQKLVEQGYRNLRIITISEAVAHAAQVSGFTNFRPIASRYQIPIHVMNTYNFTEADVEQVRTWDPDIILVNGWNRLIPGKVFSLARCGGFGVHAGHPPRGRGRAPIPWTLITDLRDLEVYLFKLDERADSGQIAGLQRVEVTQFETAETLYDKVTLAISYLYRDYLPGLIAGTQSLLTQDERWATVFEKRTAEDGIIDWQKSDWALYNFIRAQSDPYPGAFTWWKGKKVILHSAVPFDRILPFDIQAAPGQILEILPKSGLVIRTGSSPLLVKMAQVEGAERVSGSALAEAGFKVGDIFG